MDTSLEQARQIRKRSTLAFSVGTKAEREVLALLERPARYPPSLDNVKAELLRSFSELQIQNAITHLLKEGLIETVYTPKFGMGLVLSPQKNPR